MLKGALLSLIQKLNSHEAEDYRITLLKAFMQQPDIQMLSDSDDISIAQFDEFMHQALQDKKEEREQFYSPAFLQSETAASTVFNAFQSTAGRTSQCGDVMTAVIGQADDATKVALSQTAHGFYQEIKRPEYWIDDFVVAGCRPSLIRSVVAKNAIKNYRKLYLTYTHVRGRLNEQYDRQSLDQIRTLHLLCLSGVAALNMHLNHQNLNDLPRTKPKIIFSIVY